MVSSINFLDFQRQLSHKKELLQFIAGHLLPPSHHLRHLLPPSHYLRHLLPPSNHHHTPHLRRPLSTFAIASKWKIWQRKRGFWILCGRTLPTWMRAWTPNPNKNHRNLLSPPLMWLQNGQRKVRWYPRKKLRIPLVAHPVRCSKESFWGFFIFLYCYGYIFV